MGLFKAFCFRGSYPFVSSLFNRDVLGAAWRAGAVLMGGREKAERKFEGKTAALYYILLLYFLMLLIRRRLWFDIEMVYASTVFHATRRIQESGRI